MMTKKLVVGILGAAALVLSYGKPAEASAFLSLSDGVVTVSCNTSLAFSGAAPGNCSTTAGFFNPTANANSILFWGFTGAGTIGSYSVSGFSGITVTGGEPGSASAGSVTLAGGNLYNSDSTHQLTIDYGGNDFTLPVGPLLGLRASQSATWTNRRTGDNDSFTGYGRDDNALIALPGNSAVTPTCVSASTGSTSCSANSFPPDLAFTRLVTNYSLTGHEVVTLAKNTADGTGFTIGSSIAVQFPGNFETGTTPEPASIFLFASGVIGLAVGARRRKKKV